MKLDINALKEKIMELIPFGKKGEVEVDVEETPEGEEVDVEVKVKEGEEEESEEEEDEEEEDDEEAAAKKKKGLYIKVAAGIVVAFLAFDEMTKDTGEAPKKAPVKKTRAKKKKAKQPKKAPKKKVAEKKKAEPPAKKVEAPAPPPAVVKEKKPIKRDISSVPPPPPPEPPKAEKKPAELALEVEEIVEEIGTPTEEELKGPAEYVSPPDYSEIGRGLVYNCKGKHWACVDKNSFFACRDNLKWAKENGKGFECFTKDVYRNERDCRIIQTHIINTNLKTDFCK